MNSIKNLKGQLKLKPYVSGAPNVKLYFISRLVLQMRFTAVVLCKYISDLLLLNVTFIVLNNIAWNKEMHAMKIAAIK